MAEINELAPAKGFQMIEQNMNSPCCIDLTKFHVQIGMDLQRRWPKS